MPIHYCFDAKLSVLVVDATGTVTVEDRAAFVATVIRDSAMPASSPILIDATGVLNPPTIEDVSTIGALLQLLAGRFKRRIAYHVTSVGLVTPFSMAALAAELGRNEAQAFIDRTEALEWLRNN